MKALVLAAGYATRLYPLTRCFPKALLPIAGRPLLEYTMERLHAISIVDTIYVVTNARFHPAFCRWAERYVQTAPGTIDQHIEIISDRTRTNDDRLGSIGDVQFAVADQQIDDDLLVLCSDKLFSFGLGEFVAYFQTKRATVNLCIDVGSTERIRNRHGCVVVDGEGRIVDYQEKPANPKSTLESIAFYLYPKHVLGCIRAYLEEGGNPDAPGHFSEWLHRREPMFAFTCAGEMVDVGTLGGYRQADERFSRQRAGNRQADSTLPQRTAIVCDAAKDDAAGRLHLIRRAVTDCAADPHIRAVLVVAPDTRIPAYEEWVCENPQTVPVTVLAPHQFCGTGGYGSVSEIKLVSGLVVITTERDHHTAVECD